MAQNMNQANIQYLPQWRALGNNGDLPVGWTPPSATPNSSNTNSNVSVPNAVDMAKQIRQFTIDSNQPQVQTLQSSVDPLKQRYSDLLSSIKGQQSVAEGYQTRATTSSLGARGLLPQSAEGQQALASALAPTDAQYQGLAAQTGLGEQQDLNSIAQQIAALQAGNPEGAISSASNLLGLQQQASQFAQSNALQQQQLAQSAPASKFISIPGVGVYDILNKSIVNQLNGGGGSSGIQLINGVPYVNT
jgi:hypothetical protein